jgi:16S rRNA (guanine527-N7)-methyltransferase
LTSWSAPAPYDSAVVATAADTDGQRALLQLLSDARDLGFLGPGPLGVHVDHAQAFGEILEAAEHASPEGPVVDLGSGGGVPGLALALRWRKRQFVLVECQQRRAGFLREAVRALGMEGRVAVVGDRAESVGRTRERRGAYAVVTARSFGPPAVVAECAAPLLRPGGVLIVSEPPSGREQSDERWPSAGLASLGMGAARAAVSRYRFVVIPQLTACPDRFPRRVGVSRKRPLF